MLQIDELTRVQRLRHGCRWTRSRGQRERGYRRTDRQTDSCMDNRKT